MQNLFWNLSVLKWLSCHLDIFGLIRQNHSTKPHVAIGRISLHWCCNTSAAVPENCSAHLDECKFKIGMLCSHPAFLLSACFPISRNAWEQSPLSPGRRQSNAGAGYRTGVVCCWSNVAMWRCSLPSLVTWDSFKSSTASVPGCLSLGLDRQKWIARRVLVMATNHDVPNNESQKA